MTRANDPATKRKRLLHLLRSRTQADAPWTYAELATELCCAPRTVRRYREWLRDYGHLPPETILAAERTHLAAKFRYGPDMVTTSLSHAAPEGSPTPHSVAAGHGAGRASSPAAAPPSTR